MDSELIARLVGRGQQAGELILSTFDARQWDQHRWVRYLTLMGSSKETCTGPMCRSATSSPRSRTAFPASRSTGRA